MQRQFTYVHAARWRLGISHGPDLLAARRSGCGRGEGNAKVVCYTGQATGLQGRWARRATRPKGVAAAGRRASPPRRCTSSSLGTLSPRLQTFVAGSLPSVHTQHISTSAYSPRVFRVLIPFTCASPPNSCTPQAAPSVSYLLNIHHRPLTASDFLRVGHAYNLALTRRA